MDELSENFNEETESILKFLHRSYRPKKYNPNEKYTRDVQQQT